MAEGHMATAAPFAPLIERVHGEHHPELTRVRELTEQVQQAPSASRVAALFDELRAVTGNYAVPGDGCEAFEATYRALEHADAAQRLSTTPGGTV